MRYKSDIPLYIKKLRNSLSWLKHNLRKLLNESGLMGQNFLINTAVPYSTREVLFTRALGSEYHNKIMLLNASTDNCWRLQDPWNSKANGPPKYWGECILTCYIIKLLSTQVFNGKLPFELLISGICLNLDHLRVFGCLCYATHIENLDKFCVRAVPSVFGWSSRFFVWYSDLKLNWFDWI